MPFALPAFPDKFSPENSKLHFPLIMTVSITNLGKYINIYFQNTTLHYTQLFNFYINTGQRMASHNTSFAIAFNFACTILNLSHSHT